MAPQFQVRFSSPRNTCRSGLIRSTAPAVPAIAGGTADTGQLEARLGEFLACVLSQPELTPATLAQLEAELAGLQVASQTLSFSEAIRTAFLSSSTQPERVFEFVRAQVQADHHASIGESAVDWRLARKALSKSLVLHLVDCECGSRWRASKADLAHSRTPFLSSCCAYFPTFHVWHERLPWIHANIDNLDPPSQVRLSLLVDFDSVTDDPSEQIATAAFCALGARASPHSVSSSARFRRLNGICSRRHFLAHSSLPPRRRNDPTTSTQQGPAASKLAKRSRSTLSTSATVWK